MKPNDKAYREFMRVFHKTHLNNESQIMASLEAAYAAQFQSEDYAGLVKELRDASHCHQCVASGEKAADAIEALLAELKAQKEYNEVLTCKKLGDEARSAERYWEARWRDEAKENDKLKAELAAWKGRQEATAAILKQVETERDALAASLAPVDDDMLREIAAMHFAGIDGHSDDWDRYVDEAKDYIDAIRPHIEAAERERCAKIAEGNYERLEPASQESAHYKNGRLAAAAAIRSGK